MSAGTTVPVGEDLAGLLRISSWRDTSVLPQLGQQAPALPVPDCHRGALSVTSGH